MGVPRFLLEQLARPSGSLAGPMGWLLNRLNAKENSLAMDALPLHPESRVLDIGFGGGVSFPRLLETCTQGHVAGIEVSTEMVTRARRIFASDISSGRLDVQEGSVERLPWPDASFGHVLTVNTLYFWPDIDAGLAETKRVLARGGTFVASCVPPARLEKMGFGGVGYYIRTHEQWAEAIRSAGFADVNICDLPGVRGSRLIRGITPALDQP